MTERERREKKRKEQRDGAIGEKEWEEETEGRNEKDGE